MRVKDCKYPKHQRIGTESWGVLFPNSEATMGWKKRAQSEGYGGDKHEISAILGRDREVGSITYVMQAGTIKAWYSVRGMGKRGGFRT